MNKVLKFEIETPGGQGICAAVIRLWWALVAHYYVFRTFFKEFSSPHRRFDWRRNAKRDGSVAVITGGTGGIGAEVIKKLLQCHMHVIIGCRDIKDGINVVKNIRRKGITTGTAESLYLDLMSLNSVKEFAFKVQNRSSVINILINNAGIMTDAYAITVDGFEQHFQVNYLSHSLLTYLLLPRLRKCGSPDKYSRIVNVSSTIHYGASPNFSDLQMSKFYSCHRAYMDSKLLQIAFSNFLDSRLQAEGSFVRCYSVHPGLIETDLWDEWKLTRKIGRLRSCLFAKPERGADAIVYASISTQLEKDGGVFLCNSKITEPHPKTHNSKIQLKLWETSCRYLNIEDYSYAYYNNENNAPDNYNINGVYNSVPVIKSSPETILERNTIIDRIESVQLLFPFNTRYIKAATRIVMQKIERMRSAFYFLCNYE